MKHVVVFNKEQIGKLLNGELIYEVWFYKKKPDFLSKLSAGDLIYFRERGEIKGQFEVGSLIFAQKPDIGSWKWIKEVGDGKLDLTREQFLEQIKENSILLIIQIDKLEQLITSPIEIDKRSKKEWVVLGNI